MWDNELASLCETVLDDCIAWRRQLHQNPELANHEAKTAQRVAQHLRDIGVDEVYEGLCGSTGVLGILHGSAPGPVVGLRADMDALPIREESGLPFASAKTVRWGDETVPVMHACGHDAHTAMLMAAAWVLVRLRQQLCGKVLLVFQPAEEGPSPGWQGPHGAQAMLEEPIFQANRPGAMLALHVDPVQPIGTAGQLSFAAGQTCMAISAFEIRLKGMGGHGAKPWLGADTLLPAAQILQALQTIVTRNINPVENDVILTVGALHGGTKYNVIADQATLAGAVRFSDYKTRAFIERRIVELAQGIAAANWVTAETIWTMHYPVNQNDAALIARMTPVWKQVLGAHQAVVSAPRGRHIPDDFSYFSQSIPSVYALLSIAPPDGDPDAVAALHTPAFTLDERCMKNGIAALAAFALQSTREEPTA